MNLQRPNSNDATRTANRSRSIVPMSGLCSRCLDGCTGNCEVFKATFRGRELIYPGPFGEVTAGGDKDYPVDYSHLNIQGYALGARGLPPGVVGDPDTATFPGVSTETEYGWTKKIKTVRSRPNGLRPDRTENSPSDTAKPGFSLYGRNRAITI